MEIIPEKLWAVIAAIVSALGGFLLYDRRRVDTRIDKIEQDLATHKINIAVVQESLTNLKEDTQEIKEGQKDIMVMLSVKGKKWN